MVVFASKAALTTGIPTTHANVYHRNVRDTTTRLLSTSIDDNTREANAASNDFLDNQPTPFAPSVNETGPRVAYFSQATDLYRPDPDTLLRSVVERAELSRFGLVDYTRAPGTFGSANPVLSGDARYVAFISSSALVPQDTNGFFDTYVVDLNTMAYTLISASAAGNPGNAHSSAVPVRPIFMSADARFVVFSSAATNLLPTAEPPGGISSKTARTGASPWCAAPRKAQPIPARSRPTAVSSSWKATQRA